MESLAGQFINTDVLRDFLQSFEIDARIVVNLGYNMFHPYSFKLSFTKYLPFDAVSSELLTASLHKPQTNK